MKKLVLSFVFIICTMHAYCQNFNVGVIVGLASTDVLGVDAVDGDEDFNRIGIVAGGFVNRSFSKRISVQMELLYSTKGSFQSDANGFPYYKLRLDYLEVPVLFKYKTRLIVSKWKLDRLELEAGPSFGALVYSYEENVYGPVPSDRPFNKLDFLFNLGLNYYFSEDFSLDVRFANSVVPIRPHANDSTIGLTKGEYNTTFSFTLRYILD